VPVVSLDVVVTDAAGELVSNLNKDDFEIYEDGGSQQIQFFSPVSAPYNVFLLFDRSSSTQENWSFMQQAVVRFIENLRPQDRVAIAAFAKDFAVNLAWTADRKKAVSALERIGQLNDGSETRLYAALDRTLRREFKNVVGRRAVIVLTDGKDTEYAYENDGDLKKALKAAAQERVPVYFVAVEDEADTRVILPRTRQYLLEVREYMHQLADRSGGQVLLPKTLNDLMPMYAQIGRAFGTSYSLGYIPASSAKGTHRIVIKTRSAGLRITQSRDVYTTR
jgi:Ca-activated chloride channel homolog